MKKNVFREVRLLTYIVMILNFLLVQYVLPLDYRCNYTDYSCPMCGMRTAIDFAFNLNFKNALNSNPYFILVLISVVLIFIDVICILYHYKNKTLNIVYDVKKLSLIDV